MTSPLTNAVISEAL